MAKRDKWLEGKALEYENEALKNLLIEAKELLENISRTNITWSPVDTFLRKLRESEVLD